MSEMIEYIELRFADILGQLKAMVVPCKPATAVVDLARDPAMKKGTSCDGSSVIGLASVEASDLRLEPDVSSLIELPFVSQRTAAAMCFIREKTAKKGEYYPLDTRGRLHWAYEQYLPGNLRLEVKIEPEFHLTTSEGDPFDDAGYADVYPLSPGFDILLQLANALREIGVEIRVIHHEVGESQQEIELNFADARKVADNILTFKNLARSIARNHGLDVTFMPKPYEGAAGNGLHCHIQLWDGERNLFGAQNDELSDTAKSFIAGLLEHAPAITAIANPTVNSYKRLVPHHEAPVYISWGHMNRTVLVRVPMCGAAQKAAVELRSGDSMANPYLLFTVIIAAGMDGVSRKLEPIEPRSEDIFALSDKERKKLGIKTLPKSLGEALDALEHDKVIGASLGEELLESFLRTKRSEWEQYLSHTVTEWEWRTYRDF
jgi:glutamine synthetase